jgi:hypothetical protein
MGIDGVTSCMSNVVTSSSLNFFSSRKRKLILRSTEYNAALAASSRNGRNGLSYLDDNLASGETVFYRTRCHWSGMVTTAGVLGTITVGFFVTALRDAHSLTAIRSNGDAMGRQSSEQCCFSFRPPLWLLRLRRGDLRRQPSPTSGSYELPKVCEEEIRVTRIWEFRSARLKTFRSIRTLSDSCWATGPSEFA